jgi:hypothetical protein
LSLPAAGTSYDAAMVRRDRWIVAGIALCVAAAYFALNVGKGFDLRDEGFLAYGVQGVLAGEVPIRDFVAYDPGRYYWAALWALLVGQGPIGMQIAAAAFGALGVFAALLAIGSGWPRLGWREYGYLAVCAALLGTWMYPSYYFSPYNLGAALFATAMLTALVRNPSPRWYFLAGVAVGLLAVMGRNHGVYAAVASAGLILWLNLRRTSEPNLVRAAASWSIGVVVGYLPVLLMVLLVPGFAGSFWESIQFLFEARATNIARPVPWPWRIDVSQLPFDVAWQQIALGCVFVALPLYAVGSLSWVVLRRIRREPVNPALVASAFLTVPYAHYVFSRADLPHMASGIGPALVGAAALLADRRWTIRWPGVLALLALCLSATLAMHPAFRCAETGCTRLTIGGDSIMAPEGAAHEAALFRRLADKYAPHGEPFLATPYWPGAYPLLDRRSAQRDIYALLPRPVAFQRDEIERIEAAKPAFIVISDAPLDGDPRLTLKSTNPLLYRFVVDHYREVPEAAPPPTRVFIPR